ncbi:MAG: molybdopterin-dependent oxidoreductase [Desulfotomaculaceae bacterium]|nr:molybdopterin-dependent oxidoreductase [Desulfotomaculaceae bacterium]
MKRNVITTCTRDCTNTCGLVATVEHGKLLYLRGNPQHPVNKGKVCHKCARFVQRVYSPERVLTPLRRRGSGWAPISWADALDEIAGRMDRIKSRFGPEAILYYQGFGERTALKLLNTRFFNLFGGATTLYGTLCGGTGQAAQNLDVGCRISHDPLDHLNSRSLILWGRNPVITNINLTPIIKEIRTKGAPVVLIDPVVSESRRICDYHIQPAPGQDAYLAMAVAKIILARKAEDIDFLSRHSEGYEAFLKILDSFTVVELAVACDVPLEQVEYLAELLIQRKPTAILLGWGLHRWESAHYTVRCIDALNAIAGNIGVAGGGVSQGFEEYGPYDLNLTGSDLKPNSRKFLMPLIGEEILKAQAPPVEMIFVTAGNPVGMAPNSNKVAEAFAKTPFVVVAGHFLDDTTDYADIFLPSTTFLEEKDLVAGFGHNYIGPVNRVIEPLGESKSDFKMFQDLAERFSFAAEFNRSLDDWLALLVEPLLARGVSLKQLFEGPVRIPDTPMIPYADRIFPTPSGKFMFMQEFARSTRQKNEQEFPYQLMSVVARDWIGSELTLSEQSELLTVHLNAQEGLKLGLRDGDTVWLVSSVGELQVKVKLDEAQRKDLVVCPRGGWIKAGRGVNLLTRDLVSKVGNGTPYFETRVNIKPVQKKG